MAVRSAAAIKNFASMNSIAMKGERQALALLREGVGMLDGIERLVLSEQIDCDFSRCGRFRGAMRPEHYESMARDMEDLRRYAGVNSQMISTRRAAARNRNQSIPWRIAAAE